VSLAFAFASLFFLYRLIHWHWGRPTAQIALVLWVVNPLWIQHADYLHHIPYLLFFGLGCLYLLERYLRDGERLGFLLASGVFLFLTYLSSYDYWFFAPLLVAMVTYRHYGTVRGPTIRVLATLAAFAVASVAFKFATNIWGQGGWQPFLSDLRFQIVERATSKVTRVSAGDAGWPTFAGRIERCFSLLMYPIAAFWAILPLARTGWERRWPQLAERRANPWFLFFAALPFLWLFREMWIGQLYPAMLVLPFYAVAAATLISLLIASEPRSLKAVGAALFAALIGNSLVEDQIPKRAFMPPSAIETLRTQLDQVSAPGQYLLTNHIFDGLYRYYFERNIVLMILNPPARIPSAMAYYTNPRNVRIVTPDGAIYVQHKHVEDQLFDKGIYYLLADNGAWEAWGNPEKYHGAIDALVTERDSVLTSIVTRRGRRIAETPDYVLWRILPDSGMVPR
jgi:4-amino-4-deoxy-L-arabinose transferase-like glycosyltransferase